MVRSDPLVVAETTTREQTGKSVYVACREPSPCLSANLHGYSEVVHAAVDALERIHQRAHALKEDRS